RITHPSGPVITISAAQSAFTPPGVGRATVTLSETDYPNQLLHVRASLALLCAAFMLAGCATTLNVQAYTGARRPAKEVARLRALESEIPAVDGAARQSLRGGRLISGRYLALLPG